MTEKNERKRSLKVLGSTDMKIKIYCTITDWRSFSIFLLLGRNLFFTIWELTFHLFPMSVMFPRIPWVVPLATLRLFGNHGTIRIGLNRIRKVNKDVMLLCLLQTTSQDLKENKIKKSLKVLGSTDMKIKIYCTITDCRSFSIFLLLGRLLPSQILNS